MTSRVLAGVLAACLLTPAAGVAADAATLFRVFLKDGHSLVSYGEFARVGDRVVFSMPTAASSDAPLHLVDIPADRVDWPRTEQYAASARADRYIETRAEDDYTTLTNEVARTLNEVALTTDASKRLAIVQGARKALAAWPGAHFNYRWEDVQQMLSMLDEAIADLRVAAGGQRFDLSLSAYSQAPPTVSVPMLPAPTPREAIEQTLLAARLSDSPAERSSLLGAALLALDRDATRLPGDWAAATRGSTEASLDAERATDHAYETLTRGILAAVDRRARAADVRGIQRMVQTIHDRDAALGGQRPGAVTSLLDAVQAKLDAARRFRLARDRWALRSPALHRYRAAVARPLRLMAKLKPALGDIRALAGSSPAELSLIRSTVARVLEMTNEIHPPDEVGAAHALLVSAARLAGQAAQIRREAVLSDSMPRAWDASSAAAGSLMLIARATADIDAALEPPRFQ